MTGEPLAGIGAVKLDLFGTVALAVVTLGAAAETNATDLANLAVSGALFLGGCVAFGLGFVRAAGRSRTEVVDLAGLFYLTGSAPRQARRVMLGLWFAQIAVASASVFFVSPPFAVMAPVWGIGMLTYWASRHATFPSRERVQTGRPDR